MNPHYPACHTPSLRMDITRRHYTEQLPTVSTYTPCQLSFDEIHLLTPSTASKPDCTKAILQFQHGTWYVAENGSLILEPIKVDGRQQVSDPCKHDDHSIYSRYNQTELFKVSSFRLSLIQQGTDITLFLLCRNTK